MCAHTNIGNADRCGLRVCVFACEHERFDGFNGGDESQFLVMWIGSCGA